MLSHEKQQVFGRFARDLASLSKCTQKKVAAIALDRNGTQVYSIGLNGGPKGGIQCLCELDTKYGCVHAEAQCIAKATTLDDTKIMICTLSPCVTCATMIINTGFREFYYLDAWKDTTGLDLLELAGIPTYKIGGM